MNGDAIIKHGTSAHTSCELFESILLPDMRMTGATGCDVITAEPIVSYGIPGKWLGERLQKKMHRDDVKRGNICTRKPSAAE